MRKSSSASTSMLLMKSCSRYSLLLVIMSRPLPEQRNSRCLIQARLTSEYKTLCRPSRVYSVGGPVRPYARQTNSMPSPSKTGDHSNSISRSVSPHGVPVTNLQTFRSPIRYIPFKMRSHSHSPAYLRRAGKYQRISRHSHPFSSFILGASRTMRP